MEEEKDPTLLITRVPVSALASAATETPSANRDYGALDVLQSSLFRRTNGKTFAITSTGRNDGVGAQALAKITTRVMALAIHQNYAHAPFQVLEHFDAGTSQLEYCKVWEDLLQIGTDCIKAQQYPLVFGGGCDNNALNFMLSHNFQHNHLYVLRDCHELTEQYRSELSDAWKVILEELRTRYHRGLGSTGSHGPSITVAVHIRRGDAVEKRRLLDNEYYLSIMHLIEKQCPSQRFFFNLVSEGTQEDFAIFTEAFAGRIKLYVSSPSPNVRTAKNVDTSSARRCVVAGGCMPRNQHLLQRRMPTPRLPVTTLSPPKVLPKEPPKEPSKEPPKDPTADEAFKVLVDADVLVMSRSAFSYVAALYSRGIKLHPPDMWWSIPKWCEDWDNWFIDTTKFVAAIYLL